MEQENPQMKSEIDRLSKSISTFTRQTNEYNKTVEQDSFDNILITSTNGNNFTKYRINENGDLCTEQLSKDEKSTIFNFSDESFYHEDNPNSTFLVTFNKAQELKTVGNTFFCQIDEQIISFPVEDKLEDIIHPFNQKTINRLNTTSQTEFFVFLLDHGSPGKFADICYQPLLEKISENLKCKRKYIFVDACYTGLLADVTSISVNLKKILGDNLTDFSKQLHFIFNNQIVDFCNCQIEKLMNETFSDDSTKSIVSQKVTNLFELLSRNNFTNIHKFIDLYQEMKTNFSEIPLFDLFLQLSKEYLNSFDSEQKPNLQNSTSSLDPPQNQLEKFGNHIQTFIDILKNINSHNLIHSFVQNAEEIKGFFSSTKHFSEFIYQIITIYSSNANYETSNLTLEEFKQISDSLTDNEKIQNQLFDFSQTFFYFLQSSDLQPDEIDELIQLAISINSFFKTKTIDFTSFLFNLFSELTKDPNSKEIISDFQIDDDDIQAKINEFCLILSKTDLHDLKNISLFFDTVQKYFSQENIDSISFLDFFKSLTEKYIVFPSTDQNFSPIEKFVSSYQIEEENKKKLMDLTKKYYEQILLKTNAQNLDFFVNFAENTAIFCSSFRDKQSFSFPITRHGESSNFFCCRFGTLGMSLFLGALFYHHIKTPQDFIYHLERNDIQEDILDHLKEQEFGDDIPNEAYEQFDEISDFNKLSFFNDDFEFFDLLDIKDENGFESIDKLPRKMRIPLHHCFLNTLRFIERFYAH